MATPFGASTRVEWIPKRRRAKQRTKASSPHHLGSASALLDRLARIETLSPTVSQPSPSSQLSRSHQHGKISPVTRTNRQRLGTNRSKSGKDEKRATSKGSDMHEVSREDSNRSLEDFIVGNILPFEADTDLNQDNVTDGSSSDDTSTFVANDSPSVSARESLTATFDSMPSLASHSSSTNTSVSSKITKERKVYSVEYYDARKDRKRNTGTENVVADDNGPESRTNEGGLDLEREKSSASSSSSPGSSSDLNHSQDSTSSSSVSVSSIGLSALRSQVPSVPSPAESKKSIQSRSSIIGHRFVQSDESLGVQSGFGEESMAYSEPSIMLDLDFEESIEVPGLLSSTPKRRSGREGSSKSFSSSSSQSSHSKSRTRKKPRQVTYDGALLDLVESMHGSGSTAESLNNSLSSLRGPGQYSLSQILSGHGRREEQISTSSRPEDYISSSSSPDDDDDCASFALPEDRTRQKMNPAMQQAQKASKSLRIGSPPLSPRYLKPKDIEKMHFSAPARLSPASNSGRRRKSWAKHAEMDDSLRRFSISKRRLITNLIDQLSLHSFKETSVLEADAKDNVEAEAMKILQSSAPARLNLTPSSGAHRKKLSKHLEMDDSLRYLSTSKRKLISDLIDRLSLESLEEPSESEPSFALPPAIANSAKERSSLRHAGSSHGDQQEMSWNNSRHSSSSRTRVQHANDNTKTVRISNRTIDIMPGMMGDASGKGMSLTSRAISRFETLSDDMSVSTDSSSDMDDDPRVQSSLRGSFSSLNDSGFTYVPYDNDRQSRDTSSNINIPVRPRHRLLQQRRETEPSTSLVSVSSSHSSLSVSSDSGEAPTSRDPNIGKEEAIHVEESLDGSALVVAPWSQTISSEVQRPPLHRIESTFSTQSAISEITHDFVLPPTGAQGQKMGLMEDKGKAGYLRRASSASEDIESTADVSYDLQKAPMAIPDSPTSQRRRPTKSKIEKVNKPKKISDTKHLSLQESSQSDTSAPTNKDGRMLEAASRQQLDSKIKSETSSSSSVALSFSRHAASAGVNDSSRGSPSSGSTQPSPRPVSPTMDLIGNRFRSVPISPAREVEKSHQRPSRNRLWQTSKSP